MAWLVNPTRKAFEYESDSQHFHNIFTTFSDILKTFSKMSATEVKSSKGLRIKVIRFRDGMSYEKLAKGSPLGKFAIDKLRLLNGHYPDKSPAIGDLIKIVQ